MNKNRRHHNARPEPQGIHAPYKAESQHLPNTRKVEHRILLEQSLAQDRPMQAQGFNERA